ncbi:mannose-6-phosphate isomerase, class I [Nakamurella lactea]|uniref:mannose-6-phosphate isomerase, class I n=1 Tax=Nakamurella lactea TaxID=459515 RepID=UPI0012B67AEF|nr:mannose-6-phosphate isomerase, class I [Nakamurella lactea]
MTNRVRAYAWGSRTAIAELLGEPVPSVHPQAELWIGAHPGDPSVIDSDNGPISLVEHISADSATALGGVAAEFGDRLPFLLKVLAAAEPLSLQAHPSATQAKSGFAQEEAAGVEINSPMRNYKDASHKPELICALTEFHALCGFRDPATSVRLLQELASPEFDRYLTLLAGQPDEQGTRALFSSIITMPPAALMPVLDSVLAACVERVRAGSEYSVEYRTALELGERYPGDPGVLASLLMNRVTLQPGQALYLGAGNLHAYLSGTGIEIMANSDNVLRGGLTPKHVDVPELMRVLDFAVGDVPVIDPVPAGPGRWCYPTPAAEFELCRLEPTTAGPDAAIPLDHPGPRVLLVVQGTATLTDPGGDTLQVPRGRSAWIGAAESGVSVSGECLAFLATDGLTN